LLTDNRDKLDSLTERQLEKEPLDPDAAFVAAGVPLPTRATGEEPEPATY
jgi:cell division protease FtsH